MRIEVYPVGLRHDIKRRRVRRGLWYLRRQAARREWRAVKNYFNGYLAEPCPLPDGFIRCGSGWTRARALRDLQRRMARTGTAPEMERQP